MTEPEVPLADLLRAATARLQAAGVPSPRADAELLAAHALGRGAPGAAPGRGEVQATALRGATVPDGVAAALELLLSRRERRVPLQHLTGTASFRALELEVGPGVFVPRPETEVLAGLAVDAALAARAAERAAASGTPLVVDLCTGSGAVALAVATEVPAARVVAVELDPAAHAWAARNVARLAPGVDLRLGDAAGSDTSVLHDLVQAGGVGTVDVVVANPPYIPDGARPVDPEVAEHDPPVALFGGGGDGLLVPRAVVAAARALLRPGGVLLMEHADVQGPATRALVAGPGWDAVRTVPDLTGRDRVLHARRSPADQGPPPR